MSFSQKTIDFLFENRLHDNKIWYNEHKEDYKKYIAQPFEEFISAIGPTITEIDSTLSWNPKKYSRLYRDARFSRGESIFRDDMWCSFNRPKRGEFDSSPGFFFGISPRGFDYGFGYYQAGTKLMEIVRKMILDGDETFVKAEKAVSQQKVFTLEGELYKRNHYPEQTERLCNWLNRRSLYVIHAENSPGGAFRDDLAQKIAADFKAIAPLCHFLLKAEDEKNRM